MHKITIDMVSLRTKIACEMKMARKKIVQNLLDMLTIDKFHQKLMKCLKLLVFAVRQILNYKIERRLQLAKNNDINGTLNLCLWIQQEQ